MTGIVGKHGLFKAVIAALSLLLMAGCSTQSSRSDINADIAEQLRLLRSSGNPDASEKPSRLALNFTPGTTELTRHQRLIVQTWLATLPAENGLKLLISAGPDSSDTGFSSTLIAWKRIRQLGQELDHEGYQIIYRYQPEQEQNTATIKLVEGSDV
ncbi:hypothetical protein ACWJJH_06720 [Endozoicomonadaceae bacterium StTr2]